MPNKQVGIITSYLDFDKNYGGALQAYALSRQIQLLGYDAKIMPYIYEYFPRDVRADSLFWRTLRFGKAHLLPRERKRLGQKKMYRHMMAWVNEAMPMYRPERMMLADMKAAAPDFHAFVCGSDQVWSTKLQRHHCDPGMFLQFVPDGVRKIAYAPSLGSTTSVTPDTEQEIADSLADFHALSVRERAGQKLIQRITGKEAPLVLDPTLLLPIDEWNNIAEVPKNLPDRYIVLYRFGKIPANMEKIARIQKHLGLPIIELPSSLISLEDPYKKRYDINPGQFIGLIRNATLVLTDSFHATVFSILNKTPFLTFYRQKPSEKFNMNSRVEELLATTGLADRLILPDGEVDMDGLLDVSFEEAHRQIEARQAESLAYLKDALAGDRPLIKAWTPTPEELQPDPLPTQLPSAENCTGCMACYAACPHGAISPERKTADGQEGDFWYPVIQPDLCRECGLCARICPVNATAKSTRPLSILSAHATDETNRQGGSSGGIVGLLSKQVIAEGGVVYGAAFDSTDYCVKHTSSDTVSLEALSRSKYVQSDMGATYCEVKAQLKANRRVLFCGTPCQVAGLKQYLGKDYPSLLTVDFFCHGVPSPRLFGEMLRQIEKEEGSRVANITFREKLDGWRKQSMAFYLEDGRVLKKPSSEHYYYFYFLQNYTLRESCHTCDLYKAHQADLTVADDWRIDKILDDDKGISLLLPNTPAGMAAIQSISQDITVVRRCDSIDFEWYKHGYNTQNRDRFFDAYHTYGYEYIHTAFYETEKKAHTRQRKQAKRKARIKRLFKRLLGG